MAEYKTSAAADAELDGKVKAAYEHALELERKATALAEERAKFYEDAYRMLAKKPGGFKCIMAKILTFGIYRCK